MCTPVPTTPTWGDLRPGTQRLLAAHGYGLWRDLMGQLRPDVVVVSVAPKHLIAAGLGDPNDWTSAMAITSTKDGRPRARTYHIRVSRQSLGGCAPLVVWGEAAQTPFGNVCNPDRNRIGEKVLDLWQKNSSPRSAA